MPVWLNHDKKDRAAVLNSVKELVGDRHRVDLYDRYLRIYVEQLLPDLGHTIDRQIVEVHPHRWSPDDPLVVTLQLSGLSGLTSPDCARAHGENVVRAANLCAEIRQFLS